MQTKHKSRNRKSSIVNRFARPRSKRQARRVGLPQVIERPGEYAGVALAHMRGEDVPWDMIKVWELTYRCVRVDGRVDHDVDIRRLIALTRSAAVDMLAEWLAGFGVQTILLYHVSGPLTLAEIAELKAINEAKAWKETTTEDTESTEK